MEQYKTHAPETRGENERPILGVTADGAIVRDAPISHFHSEGDITKDLLAAVLATIETDDVNRLAKEVKFDRPIGYTNCVDVGPDDEIEMVIRKGRLGRTPMAKNRTAQETPFMTVVIKKDPEYPDGGNYNLSTCYAGELAPREPWDPSLDNGEEVRESEEFWSKHALVYNEDLIDKEKTEEYNNMSDEEKRIERIREKTLYAGVFIEADDLFSKAPATLEKRIKTPHVTTSFRPTSDQLHLDQLGSGARIIAIGYGNDGKNEGLLVKIEADDPEIQAACDQLDKPHITLSTSADGLAKNTVNLDFQPLEEPIELTGKYGLSIFGEIVDNLDDLSNLTN